MVYLFSRQALLPAYVLQVMPGKAVFPDYFHPNATVYWTAQARIYFNMVQFDGLMLVSILVPLNISFLSFRKTSFQIETCTWLYMYLFISEFLWLCRVAVLKCFPVHPFNCFIFPILRDCLQSVCIFLSYGPLQ